MSSAADIERELVASREEATRFDPWKLRLLRAKARVDLRGLATAANLGRSGHTNLSRYESGVSVPPLTVVEEIAAALTELGSGDVQPEDLASAPAELAENAGKHARWRAAGGRDVTTWLAKAANRSGK